jgi:glycosyltransferase involved in cell wall biosynthesis
MANWGDSTNQDYQPFVSVVIPVFNGERTIRVCLESIIAQDYSRGNYEILIVDNNSNDSTCSIVQEYPVQLIHERNTQTSYAARNKGISAAKGDIVVFTDADCKASSNWLTQIVSPFSDLRVVGVGGKVLDSEPQNDVELFLFNLQMFSHYQKENSFLPVIMTNNAAYRRDLLLKMGCFKANLFTAADIDLSWRLQLETNGKVVFNEQAVIYHMQRNSISGMAKQFRRHGFGEVFLDAMYRNYSGYKRTPKKQLSRMGKQVFALFTYMFSILKRSVSWIFGKRDRTYVTHPYFMFIAEANNLIGKMQAFWATRFLTQNPEDHLWIDPLER